MLASTKTVQRRSRLHPQIHPFRRQFSLHGLTVEVTAPRLLTRTLGIVLDAYPSASTDAVVDFGVSVSRVAAERPIWRVVSGEQERFAHSGVEEAARWTEWVLVSEALKRWTAFVHIHAAVLANAHKSMLLIGRSGSGKSTTSVALALAGLRLFTDDVALVDRETLRPVVVPRPVKLDQRSRRLLRPRGLVIPRGTWLGESIDRTVIPGLPPVDEPGPPLAAALFFADARAAEPSLRPITAAEAMMRLVLQSSSERFEHTAPPEGAIALVNAVPCYELVPADLDATVRAVCRLLDGHDARTA